MTRRKKKSLKKLIYYVKCGWLACEKKNHLTCCAGGNYKLNYDSWKVFVYEKLLFALWLKLETHASITPVKWRLICCERTWYIDRLRLSAVGAFKRFDIWSELKFYGMFSIFGFIKLFSCLIVSSLLLRREKKTRTACVNKTMMDLFAFA